MAHPHGKDDELYVQDFVDDPVIANAQPVAVLVPGELLDVGVLAAWIVAERDQCVKTPFKSCTTMRAEAQCHR